MATPAPTLNATNPTPIQSTSQIQYDASGKLVGIDGVLDQIGGALSRQATPLIRDLILPALREDKDLQRTVGAAAGRAIASELKPFLFLFAGIAVYAVWRSYRSPSTRPNPTVPKLSAPKRRRAKRR